MIGLGRHKRPAARLMVVCALLFALSIAGVAPPTSGAEFPPPAGGSGEFVPGRVLVEFDPGAGVAERAAIAVAHGLRAEDRPPVLGVRRFAVAEGRERAAVAALRRHPRVRLAELDHYLSIAESPNDPGYPSQWGLQRIGAATAWSKSTGAGVVVAVVDTGADLTHPDLAANLVAGYNVFLPGSPPQDDHGHGTHVAGIVAAVTNNGVGVAGTAPGARVMPVRALGSSGTGPVSHVADGIIWAADNGARVINLSLGASETKLGGEQLAVLRRAVDHALASGAVVVAAAGNENSGERFYPAAFPGVIAVAATGSNDLRWSGSNYGPWIDLAAPGVGIYSTYLGGSYASATGTSMAAPFVAGVVALLREEFPGEGGELFNLRLCAGALDLGAPGWDEFYGCGRLDALAALGDFEPMRSHFPLIQR